MTGVTDEQCRQMAQNLEFKGSALTEVHAHVLLKVFRYFVLLIYNVMLVNLGCHSNQEPVQSILWS